MNLFEGVEFQGTFHRYQQRVLNNADSDKDIGIVAPPGSGKTILGLELIRRAGERCLIISPTEAARDRWGKSLREHFLKEDSLFEEIFSTDLENAKWINAITYEEFLKRVVGGRPLTLRKVLPRNSIKTLCLDVTHSMTKEVKLAWRRTGGYLQKDINRIELYSDKALACGRIDEEIILPELVAEKVLSPHQEYIYFSHTHREELGEVFEYMERVGSALNEIGKLEMLKEVPRAINKETLRKSWIEETAWYCRYIRKEYNWYKRKKYNLCKERLLTIIPFLQYYELDIDWRSVKKLTGKTELPPVAMEMLDTAIWFLMNYQDVPLVWKNRIREILIKYRLYEDGRGQFVPNELLQKILPVSRGKVQSICEITKQEYEALGEKLRLLVFTDGMYEKKQHFSFIGTSKEFSKVDAISIFETLRRQDMGVKIGVLTERLLILPDLPQLQGTMLQKEPLGETGYCTVEVVGDMQEAVLILKQLFQQGELQVLIGNQRLMEEGRERISINSLILPGFSENPIPTDIMRWMALQGEKDQSDKVVNIWHLVSLMPENMVGCMGTQSTVQLSRIGTSYLESRELVEVANRFEQYIGPDFHYEKGEMKSGIHRISLLQPPYEYDAMGIQRINQEMLTCSADREKVGNWWKENVESKSFRIVQETEILPKKIQRIILPIGRKSLLAGFSLTLYIAFLPRLFSWTWGFPDFSAVFFADLVLIVLGILLLCSVKNIFRRWWKQRNLKEALKYQAEELKAELVEKGKISNDAVISIKKVGILKSQISIQLRNALLKEQSIFSEAIIKKISPKAVISDNRNYIIMYDEEEKNG